MTNPTIEALKEAIPAINEFRINPVGGDNITVEGNQWFCHSHEVKAYKDAVKALITQLEAASVKPVDIEAAAEAMLALQIPDGFDRNGSHFFGTYQEYKWSLGQYLRPQDKWKAEELARACAQSFGLPVGGEGKR